MKKLLFVSFAVFMGIFIGINAFGETTNEAINTGGDITNSIPAEVTQDSAPDFSLKVDNFKYDGPLEEGESRKLLDGDSSGTSILYQIETDGMKFLEQATSLEQAANGCPVYNTPTVVIENSSCANNPSGWVRLEGHVSLNGQPLNAMVLANGQYMFSSGAKMNFGDYELTVPLDASNSITLFAFVSGMLPYQKTFKINPITCNIIGCGQGFPLKISDLDFPTVVTQGKNYYGSVKYEGSFEYIANPRMFTRFQVGTTIYIVMVDSTPTASDNCYIDFIGGIASFIYGTGTTKFLLVDYDAGENNIYNWNNNAVSNELSQTITINK